MAATAMAATGTLIPAFTVARSAIARTFISFAAVYNWVHEPLAPAHNPDSSCAICLEDWPTHAAWAASVSPPGNPLLCGHKFCRACLLGHQGACGAEGRAATCPECRGNFVEAPFLWSIRRQVSGLLGGGRPLKRTKFVAVVAAAFSMAWLTTLAWNFVGLQLRKFNSFFKPGEDERAQRQVGTVVWNFCGCIGSPL